MCGSPGDAHERARLASGPEVSLCPGYSTFFRTYDGPNDYTTTGDEVLHEVARDIGEPVAALERRLSRAG